MNIAHHLMHESSPESEPPIVIARNLEKTFDNGVKALDDFSLSVERSEVVVIIGPSGSGKSTFLRCLNGLEEIDSGSIVIDGLALNHDKANRLEIRKEVGMVFQHFNLFPHRTVRQNIDLAQVLVRKKSRQEAETTTMELLGKVGLTDKADTFPNHLSGGQQQRVAIARALAMKPKIMLFDEATSALDPGNHRRGPGSDESPGGRRHDHGRGHPRDGLRTRSRGPHSVHGGRTARGTGRGRPLFRQPGTGTDPAFSEPDSVTPNPPRRFPCVVRFL